MGYVCVALQAFTVIIVLRMVLTFFPLRAGGFWAMLNTRLFGVTEPLMAPMRRKIPMLRLGAGALDITPVLLLVLMNVVISILCYS